MSAPTRYLRLFDLEKYREIQPIIEGITQPNVDPKQATCSLFQRALSIIKTDDYKKYSDPERFDSDDDIFQEILDSIQEEHISTYVEIKRKYSIDIARRIVAPICCPKYQYSTYDVEIVSGTTFEYGYGYYELNQEIADLLNFDSSMERMLCDEDTIIGIFSPQQLAELTELVEEDISTLYESTPASELIFASDESFEYLRFSFYNELSNLLKLANSQPNYTILNEFYI